MARWPGSSRMLDRDIAKLRQIRITGKGDTSGQLPSPCGVPDLPLRWRLDHVLGYNPPVAAP
jgi:hypothetical protein